MREIEATALKARIDSGETPLLLDVREDWELERASIEGAQHIPMDQIPARHSELSPDQEIVVLCHHGARSAQVVRFLENNGFSCVINLAGGIDAWAQQADRDVPTY